MIKELKLSWTDKAIIFLRLARFKKEKRKRKKEYNFKTVIGGKLPND